MQQELAVPGISDLTGTSVGRFAVRDRLGAGGMGEVYRAEDTKLKRSVALKRIAPAMRSDERYRHRLWKEAQLASHLNDPHIAAVYDVIEERQEIFLVMEFVEGQTLRRRLNHPFSLSEFLVIAIQCASAVAAAHKQGILHRDVKPENVMLDDTGQVKILDFGVAKRLPSVAEQATQESMTGERPGFTGTTAYLAPEVLQEKEPDARADLFALGVVYYEMLGGVHPFRSSGFLATCQRILNEVPSPLRELNPKVTPEIERIVAKLLAKDPADRCATAADLVVDLRAAQRAITVQPLARPQTVRAPRIMRAVRWAGAGVAAIVIALILVPSVRRKLKEAFGFPAVPQEKQVAVLPFSVAGDDPQSAAFSNGLAETLTAKLTQLTTDHSLQVVPALELRARHVTTLDQARKEFGINLAVEGSLHRSGNLLRINYALVDARTHRQLRADSVVLAATEPFAVQDQVVDGAVNMLGLEVPARMRQILGMHGTQVAGAYSHYLEGRGFLQEYDRAENLDSAIKAFQQALELDPRYALAFAALGQTYWMKYQDSKLQSWLAPARQACDKSLSLDQNLAAAHVCLGNLDIATGRYEEAVAQMESALATEPTSDDAYRGLAHAYQELGKLEDAEKTYRRAIDLRPQYWAGYSWLGVFYYGQARYAEAAQMFKQVVALAPDSIRGYYNLGATYNEQGDYASAIEVLEKSIAIRPTGAGFSNLANAYFYSRRFDDSVEPYEQAVKLDEQDYRLWWNLGDAYYWSRGRKAQAAGAYERAISLTQRNLKMNPRDVDALKVLAMCQAMTDQKQAALASLKKALQLAPSDPDLFLKAALIYNHFGDDSQALKWLGKSIASGQSASKVRGTPDFDHLHGDLRFQKLLQGK
jgi:serine/threonine protein kinase/tetratricopeptide (TPR) repeat protein